MAEFHFFGTREDSMALLSGLMERGDLRVYVDTGPHEKPEAPAFMAMNAELATLLKSRTRVFLFGDFSTHPPLFELQDSGPYAGKYYMFQSGGGPLITLDFAGISTVGPPVFGSGCLSTQPLYQLEPGHYEKPTPVLKAAYTDLVKRAKKLLHLQRQQGVWITPEALRLVNEGKVRPPRGLQPAASASAPPAEPLPRAAAGE